MKKLLVMMIIALATAAVSAQAPEPPAAPAPPPRPARLARPARQAPPAPPAAPAPAAPNARRPGNEQAPPLPPPAPAPSSPRPTTPAQLVNIRIDVVVTEDGGTAPQTRKTATLLLADRQGGSVRSFGRREGANNGAPARVNVDAFPVVERDGRVRLQVTLEYGVAGADDTSVRVEPLLESGKTIVVSQSTNPTSDRRVTVELTATVLK